MFKRYLPPAHILCLLVAVAIVSLVAPEHAVLAKGLSAFAFMSGVVNVKATAITNSDREFVSGLPNNLNPLLIASGKVKARVGLCAKGAADSNNSVYRFARIASRDRIKSLTYMFDAIAGLTAVDIGAYDTAINGGAVVSQHLFATGVDVHLGQTAPVEARYLNLAAATAEQALWQLLGLASDPGKDYDLAFTATTAGGNAGNMLGEVLYVTPDA